MRVRRPDALVIGTIVAFLQDIGIAGDAITHIVDRKAVVLDAVGEAADHRAIAALVVGAGIVGQAVEALHHIGHFAVAPRHADGCDYSAVIRDLDLHAPGI